uniref:Phytanoyl-CoA dioxygenase n=1 Tax=Steinernema glaseri TaxID=37863 RepID=A0A1I7YFU6_9BILA
MDLTGLKEKFDRDGFVVIDNVFTPEELDGLKKRMGEIVDEMNPDDHPKSTFSTYDEDKHAADTYFLESADKIRFFYEEGSIGEDGNLVVPKELAFNKVGHALHWLDNTFKNFTFQNNVKEIIRKVGYEKPEIVQSMYIFKQPKIGGAVTDHIDGTFLQVEPINNVMGVWIPVDDATQENGCLWFIPGSHKVNTVDYRFVRTHTTEPNKPLLTFRGRKLVFDQERFIPVPIKRGSLVLIHGLVAHKSEPNTSEKSRHAYTFHIVDSNNTVWCKDNWLQSTETYKFPNLYEN